MKQLLVIGDVHTKRTAYHKLLKQYGYCYKSIQVGDLGFKTTHDWFLKNIDCEKHKVNFGNHDFMPYLNKPHSLGNFTYMEEEKLMTIRGGISIDKHQRTEGVDWFDNEQMNYGEALECFDLYYEKKPEIVISHQCPFNIQQEYFATYDYPKNTTTGLLQACFEAHQPKLWIFGHYHKRADHIVNGTRFICLAELETITISSQGIVI